MGSGAQSEAKRRGQTRSHLIREAIDERYLARRSPDEILGALDESFGAWEDRSETGEEYVERIRSGDRWRELWTDRGEEKSVRRHGGRGARRSASVGTPVGSSRPASGPT